MFFLEFRAGGIDVLGYTLLELELERKSYLALHTGSMTLSVFYMRLIYLAMLTFSWLLNMSN